MAGLTITITDAGRAALINQQNIGTAAVTIAAVGISSTHTPGSLKGLSALPGELKQVATFGGQAVADDVFHVTINDDSADVYTVRAFGLYLDTGELFAVFSSASVIVEKSAAAMVLLSADVTLKTLDTAVIQFGGAGFTNPPASEGVAGVLRLATPTEVMEGESHGSAVTPWTLRDRLAAFAASIQVVLDEIGVALSGKAAAVHRHAMADIDGLLDALNGGVTPGNHVHDAADVTTGVFNEARIPLLQMAKISGLELILSLKAATNHTHDIGAVSGLDTALAGKSAVGHTHSTGDVSGLATALAGKSAVGHTHATSEVAGLDTQLAARAVLGASVSFANVSIAGFQALHAGNPDAWLPAGRLELYDAGGIPTGARALVANGAAVSRSTYSRLYAVIGTRYGAGDGSSTFNLPDWRGVFFRGLDNGRGLDSGRSLGVFQDSQNLAHTHGLPVRSNPDAGTGWVEDAAASGTIMTATTYSEGGSEARPVNQALLACITY